MRTHLDTTTANEIVIRKDLKFGYIWSVNFHGVVFRGSHFSKVQAFLEIERKIGDMKRSMKAYVGRGEKKNGRWLVRMKDGEGQIKNIIVGKMSEFVDIVARENGYHNDRR